MIEPMKKITLLCLEDEREQTLKELRSLAIFHVAPKQVREKTSVASAAHGIETLESTIAILSDCRVSGKTEPRELPPEQCVAEAAKIRADRAAADKRRESFVRQAEALEPWGEFSPESVRKLEAAGIHAAFCSAPEKEFPALPEGELSVMAGRSGSTVYFLVLSFGKPVDETNLNVLRLPQIPRSEALAGADRESKAMEECNSRLAALVCNLPALRDSRTRFQGRLDFAEAAESMASARKIAWLEGYVPLDRAGRLRDAAAKFGWALLIEDPAPDDENVPTCIRKPAWEDIMDPLFDFIGVSPGYRENDVNLFFLLFFPVFFGMIVGDAGYATLFLLAVFLGKYALRGVEKARLPLNLFFLLSLTTLIWGWLHGSWFGLPRHVLPGFMQGLDFLGDPSASPAANHLVRKLGLLRDGMTDSQVRLMWDSFPNKVTQWFCFLLAALHLTSARIFKFAVTAKHDWRSWGNLGWACFIVANFFMAVNLIVFPNTFPKWGYVLYGIGFVLVSVTTTAIGALNLPFSIIGSFTDVLSYIRLFAVGLAGTYIAVNFNRMGVMLLDGHSGFVYFLALLGLIVIAVFGHVLNIALCFLSVMVHGIRLNTLEFSNHVDMQWAGIKYKPFADDNESLNQNKTNTKECAK